MCTGLRNSGVRRGRVRREKSGRRPTMLGQMPLLNVLGQRVEQHLPWPSVCVGAGHASGLCRQCLGPFVGSKCPGWWWHPAESASQLGIPGGRSDVKIGERGPA